MTYRYVPPMLYRLGQFALLVEALIRGLSYFVGHGVTQTVEVAALSAPVPVWGGAFILFATLGITGEILMDTSRSEHRYWPSLLGHSGLMCLFVAMTLAGVFAAGATGIVPPTTAALLALWHWIFARRRKYV